MLTDYLLPVVGSVATALAAALAASLVAWQSSRTRSGRLLRTVDQVNKICDLSERLGRLEDSFASRNTDELHRVLLRSCLTAVSEDFENERNILQQFQTSTGSARTWMLLTVPKRAWVWPLQICFHATLFMMVIVFVRGIVFREWRVEDSILILIALASALILRLLAVYFERTPLAAT
ncbi:MAG: hypothetical protein JWR40_4772 [Massilia sp.]|jgi:hypothetical protein|nr:hypothetical protein [Massilia sp.]MDB5952880.1 hypothetical protein [Massilia sp.]